MAKIRIHQLAKELAMSNKDLVARLLELGFNIKNHMSTLEDDEVARVRQLFEKNGSSRPGQVEPQRKNQQDRDESKRPGVSNKQVNPNHREVRHDSNRTQGKPEVSHPQGNKAQSQGRQEGGRPQKNRSQGHAEGNHLQGTRSRDRHEANRPQGRTEGYRHEGGHTQGRSERNHPDNNRTPVRSEGRYQGPKKGDGRKPDERKQDYKKNFKKTDGRKSEFKKAGTLLEEEKRLKSEREERRKKALARKEELKRVQQQSQQKFLTKTATVHTHGKKRHKGVGHSTADDMPNKISINEQISVQELADRLKVDGGEVIKKLMELGVMASLNQPIDSETATLVAEDFGVEVEVSAETANVEALLEDTPDDPQDLKPRPPVITVMGHVDHGKTSVLDAIRKTKVTATEAGGITQHIGAYQVELKGKKITFIDTPGHEAFTAMRARGAQVTDIAVLVVAADDGVMPQTVEAINHAKAAGVPIVVAINKIDKANANPERVKQQLTEYGLVAEEWGGDTICIPVSAHTKEGLDRLLEMLLLVAEMEELKANPNRPARGSIIDAQLDKGRGPVATMLVQKGTLQVGDYVLAGTSHGKVRAMLDFKGRRIKKALPSTPVEILGLSEVPNAGDSFYVISDEKTARQIAEARVAEKRQQEITGPGKITLEDLFNQIKEGKIKELNLIVKADVQGSVEALLQSVGKLGTDEVRVNVIHSGVGAITENDVMLASASNGLIIGFNVRPDSNAEKIAEMHQVEIRLYRVIYEAIDDIKAALEGLLEPEYKEVVVGRSEVRETIKVPKVGIIAGCFVNEGKVLRNSKVRVVRDGVVIHEGSIVSLKRFKDDVKEVAEGFECGIGLDKFQDLKVGDILEGYTVEEVKKVL